jgi:mono/diheme cytochrome c family protein
MSSLSDSELYFIVANGIRNTAMPAFGAAHSPDDMWLAILWVRHLPAEDHLNLHQQVAETIEAIQKCPDPI